jgi:hypothetical protein
MKLPLPLPLCANDTDAPLSIWNRRSRAIVFVVASIMFFAIAVIGIESVKSEASLQHHTIINNQPSVALAASQQFRFGRSFGHSSVLRSSTRGGFYGTSVHVYHHYPIGVYGGGYRRYGYGGYGGYGGYRRIGLGLGGGFLAGALIGSTVSHRDTNTYGAYGYNPTYSAPVAVAAPVHVPAPVFVAGPNWSEMPCRCAGVHTSWGGSSCRDGQFNGRRFCYVTPGTCSDGAMLTAEYGVAATGMEWSYKVCENTEVDALASVPPAVHGITRTASNDSDDTSAAATNVAAKDEQTKKSNAAACRCSGISSLSLGGGSCHDQTMGGRVFCHTICMDWCFFIAFLLSFRFVPCLLYIYILSTTVIIINLI